ncbi:MAG TPA: hypothetical protein VKU19_27635 [Bryobacteraceae bacterium]|nr:hypothetical protein [Bryobacteraceae bacterium]
MRTRIDRFVHDEEGQDLAEYSLLIVFVMLAIIGLAVGYGNNVAGVVSATNTDLARANTAVTTGSPVF